MEGEHPSLKPINNRLIGDVPVCRLNCLDTYRRTDCYFLCASFNTEKNYIGWYGRSNPISWTAGLEQAIGSVPVDAKELLAFSGIKFPSAG